METVKCVKCGKICKPDCIVAGYAVDNEGNKYCYKCAAKKSAQTLRDLPIGGKTYLYLVARNNSWSVQDFMGLLSIPVYHVKLGRHNIAGIRYDFWFEYHDNLYHGVVYGRDSQLARIKRIKGNAGR